MNQKNRFSKLLAIAVILTLALQIILPGQYAAAKTAKVAINQTKLTLEVGKSKALKITGTKAAVTWKSSKATVATVSKTGKVTAVKAGKAVVTATVNKKKYTCAVTVKKVEVSNPLVDAAPFKAQAATTGTLTYIFPSDWTKTEEEADGVKEIFLAPSADVEGAGTSSVVFDLYDSTGIPDADTLKAVYDEVTTDSITSQYAQLGLEVTVENLTVESYETDLGAGYVMSFDLTYSGVTMKQAIYDIYTNNYLFKVQSTDIGDGATPDVSQVTQYLLDTAKFAK